MKLDDLKYWYTTDTQGVDLKNYILENGDLLVNFSNSLSQIGKCCIFEEQNRPYIFTTNIFSIKVDEKRIINKYFYYYSQTGMYKKDIQNITKPAVNQASFTKADFEGLKIALPWTYVNILDTNSLVFYPMDRYHFSWLYMFWQA